MGCPHSNVSAMAIEKRTYANRTTYRANWRNPFTKKIEKGEARETRHEAEKDDALIKYRLKYDIDFFIPAKMLPSSKEKRTLNDLIPLYLERKDLQESTRETEFYHLKSVGDTVGNIAIDSLTRDAIKEFEASQLKSGIKQNTVHRRVGLIRSILNWAMDIGLIKENPIYNYRVKRGEDKKNPPPSPHEVALLIEHARYPHLKRAIILSYYLGVRVGESELLQLKWDDLDVNRRRMRVWSAKKNKSMAWRDLDLVDSLFSHMMEWRERDLSLGAEYIVHFKGKKIGSIKSAWRSLIRQLKDAKLIPEKRHFRPYDLRHAYGTETIARGADPRTVADNMGHADTSMLHRHYQHPLDEQKKKVQESVPDILNGVQERGTKQSLSGYFPYPVKILFQ